jgi:hypothetical protein
MTSPAGWLPALIEMRAHGGNWERYLDTLYAAFRADFLDSQPDYRGKRWAMKRHPMHEGKEATFWHIISEGSNEAEREIDFRRCERIRWPRAIIDACRRADVNCWLQRRQGGERRIAISLADFSYLVVLADRGDYVLLWTAFPVERAHRRSKLQRDFEDWCRSGEKLDP